MALNDQLRLILVNHMTALLRDDLLAIRRAAPEVSLQCKVGPRISSNDLLGRLASDTAQAWLW